MRHVTLGVLLVGISLVCAAAKADHAMILCPARET
jgi:hypothetical protein